MLVEAVARSFAKIGDPPPVTADASAAVVSSSSHSRGCPEDKRQQQHKGQKEEAEPPNPPPKFVPVICTPILPARSVQHAVCLAEEGGGGIDAASASCRGEAVSFEMGPPTVASLSEHRRQHAKTRPRTNGESRGSKVKGDSDVTDVGQDADDKRMGYHAVEWAEGGGPRVPDQLERESAEILPQEEEEEEEEGGERGGGGEDGESVMPQTEVPLAQHAVAALSGQEVWNENMELRDCFSGNSALVLHFALARLVVKNLTQPACVGSRRSYPSERGGLCAYT